MAGSIAGVLNLIPSGAPPTVFELLTQQQLVGSFRPAFDYFVDGAVAPIVPTRLVLPVLQRKDELWALLRGFVEYSYLRSSRATLAESWYGLWREPLAPAGAVFRHGRLSGWPLVWSIVGAVGVPYVAAKMDKWYAEGALLRQLQPPPAPPLQDVVIPVSEGNGDRGGEGGGREEPPPATHTWRRFVACAAQFVRAVWRFVADAGRDALRRCLCAWPQFRIALRVVQGVYLWGYAFGLSTVHSPFLHLARVRLARVSADDMRAMQRAGEAGVQPSDDGLATSGRVLSTLRAARTAGATALRYTLVAGFVAFNVANWWFSNESDLQRLRTAGGSTTHLQVPPAPAYMPQHGPVPMPIRKGECPLCRKPIANATATTAGVVYCFVCIHKFVGEHAMCAVSGQPCKQQQLGKVRIAS